jgi:hypothetical protein
VLGVGLGWHRTGEFDPRRYGEEEDPRARARLLDEGLDRLLAYWDGEFQPRPVQPPRIPVWVAAGWPHRRPLRRALRWVVSDRPARPRRARRAGRRGSSVAWIDRHRQLRPGRDEPARDRPCAVDRGRRHLVPDGTRCAAQSQRGAASDRRIPTTALSPGPAEPTTIDPPCRPPGVATSPGLDSRRRPANEPPTAVRSCSPHGSSRRCRLWRRRPPSIVRRSGQPLDLADRARCSLHANGGSPGVESPHGSRSLRPRRRRAP